MEKKEIDEINAEFNRKNTEEDKIIYFYENLEKLFMKQNVSFSCAYFGKSIIDKLEFVLAFFRK